jgi:serine/threonine protein kinase
VTGRGELIAGRYGLLARVGEGATDVVWQARDELLGRIVAVRQLPPLPDDLAEDRDSWVAAQPRHPNAVMVHDAVAHGGRHYLVMEHFPARNLAELVDATGPLTEEAAARIGAQISGALAAAHAKGIAHRDITPASILVGSDDTAKITGFGVSRAHGDAAEFFSDVLSLGTTLHAALDSGQGRRTKPFTRRRGGPLVDVLLWMRRRDPGGRPAMRAAHDALTAVVDGRPTGAPRPEPEPKTARGTFRPARRARRPVRAAVAAIILLVAGAPVGIRILDSSGGTAGPRAPDPPVTSSTTSAPEPRAPESPPGTTTAPPVPMATATTSIATTPTTTYAAPTTTENPAPACAAHYRITTIWPGGYRAEITVVNKAGAITGWTVRWGLPTGHTITNLWDGHLTRRDSAVSVTNLDYNGRLPAGGTTIFGFTADAPGSPYLLARTIPALTCEGRAG